MSLNLTSHICLYVDELNLLLTATHKEFIATNKLGPNLNWLRLNKLQLYASKPVCISYVQFGKQISKKRLENIVIDQFLGIGLMLV